MSQRERAPLRAEPREEQEHQGRRRPATGVESILALQRGAGNQAVARQLQRYYEHPTWTHDREGFPCKLNGQPVDPQWTENGKKPAGAYFVKDDDQWWRFNARSGRWGKSPEPGVEQPAARPKTQAAPETKPGAVAETKPEPPEEKEHVHAPAPEFSATGQGAMEHVFGYLDAAQLRGMRELDSYFRVHGSSALREHLRPQLPDRLGALSSLNTAKSLLQQYHDAIAERPPESLVIAAHQVNPAIVDRIVEGFPKAVQVYRGERKKEDPADGKTGRADYKTVEGPSGDHSSKMHNKAVVGLSDKGKGQFLLSGSPNLSKSAMDDNTESAVSVRFPGIAQMYKEYIEHIRDQKHTDPAFSAALKGFNETNPVGIRAALAPFVDIGETLNAELQGADQVTVRMFLVGDVRPGDPVSTLCALAKSGAQVNVIVDHEQAQTIPYVRVALEKLRAAGVTVATEKGKHGSSIMHDKLVFAHHPKVEAEAGKAGSEERYTVMVGSSGLTKNVVENSNFENLLIIDDKKLFDALKAHSRQGGATAGKRFAGIPEIKANSPLGKITAALKAKIPTRTSPPVADTEITTGLKPFEARMLDDAARLLGMVMTPGPDDTTLVGYPA